MKKSITETIQSLEAARSAKEAAMLGLNEKAAGEGRTKDETEREEFDGLAADIDALDTELKDWRRQESIAKRARAVDPEPSREKASDSRGTSTIVRVNDRVEKGIRFARVVKALWQARKGQRDIESVARHLYPDDALVQKAAVAAASTTGDTWGHELVGEEGGVFADFVEFLRPQTILGRFGQGGVPSLRNVPFRTPLIGQTGGGEGYWVGEGKAKPLTSFDFTRRTLEPLKVANIAVSTKELLRSSSPAADGMLRDSLAGALRERLDIDFIDPAKTEVAGVSPASITNGAPSIGASGEESDDVRTDVRSVFATFIAANNAPTTGVWIMSSGTALALSLMINALGQQEFPGLGMMGGTFFGLPVITSEHVGDVVVLVNASDIYLADEGGISVDVSTEASLEMSDGPSHDSTTPTGASLVSMFQTNSVAFLAEREINWARRRDSAVAVLTDVAWGGAVNEPDEP
jgi:HK97 family phage major capsid protein